MTKMKLPSLNVLATLSTLGFLNVTLSIKTESSSKVVQLEGLWYHKFI